MKTRFCLITITFFLSIILSGCRKEIKTISEQSSLKSFSLTENYRAWQGVTVDKDFVYIFTDRNEDFGLENIISLYSFDGKKIREYRNAYTGKDSQGKFMSFGDGNLIDGKLYITSYNCNSGGFPYESRVLVYLTPEMELENSFDIGGGIAESVTKHSNYYWVTYDDQMIVNQFDLFFNFIKSYPLSEPMKEYGGYQGAYWDKNNFFVQMHGPNKSGLSPSKGMDRYWFNGDKLIFRKTEPSLSYGAGQGVAVYGIYFIQNDRPNNSIVVKRQD